MQKGSVAPSVHASVYRWSVENTFKKARAVFRSLPVTPAKASTASSDIANIFQDSIHGVESRMNQITKSIHLRRVRDFLPAMRIGSCYVRVLD